MYSYTYIYMLYCVCYTLYHTIRCHVDVVITGIHSIHHSLIHSIHENALHGDYGCIAMQHVMYNALHHCTDDSVCVFIHIHIHAVLCMLYVVSYHTMPCDMQYTVYIIVSYTASMRMHCMGIMHVLLCSDMLYTVYAIVHCMTYCPLLCMHCITCIVCCTLYRISWML